MTYTLSILVVLKTLTLVLGGLITYYAVKAYRRTGSNALRALAIGFGVITVGALIAGVFDQVLAISMQNAIVAESALTAIGFAVILYSLFAK